MNPITPATDPGLFADLCDLVAKLLRERAGTGVNVDAHLNRVVGEFAAALAYFNRRAAGVRPLTVKEAVDAAGVSEQTIRNWCLDHKIGEFDLDAGRWRISRSKLRQYYLDRHGQLPQGLKEE